MKKTRILKPLLLVLLLAFILPQASLAAGSPVLSLSSVAAAPGETVTVTVELKNNPGVMALLFQLSYDHARLSLTGAEGVSLTGWDRSGDRLLWLGEKNSAVEGTILKLNFQISAAAATGEVPVTLLCGEGDVTNEAEEALTPVINAGKVAIVVPENYVPAADPSKSDLPAIPFKDVPEDAYYHDAVAWAYGKGVTKGRSDDVFDPLSTCTRGEVVTFLWRAAGCVKPSGTENPFADVKESDYFYEPVLWAVEKGITRGTDATSFSPQQTCSTAHIITFIYRAMGVGEDGWYKAAGDWANGLGLLNDTKLLVDPAENCPRGAVVACLYRWAQQQ